MIRTDDQYSDWELNFALSIRREQEPNLLENYEQTLQHIIDQHEEIEELKAKIKEYEKELNLSKEEEEFEIAKWLGKIPFDE